MTEPTPALLQNFAAEFRDALIGTQPKASRGMCALVSIPLRAALKVLQGVETDLVTQDGHTFLVTREGRYRLDPTIDQFEANPAEKILVAPHQTPITVDERLSCLPFVEVLEQYVRLQHADGLTPSARGAGSFVATYIYYPLAQQGFFDERMQ